jgi:hypothetical protein
MIEVWAPDIVSGTTIVKSKTKKGIIGRCRQGTVSAVPKWSDFTNPKYLD